MHGVHCFPSLSLGAAESIVWLLLLCSFTAIRCYPAAEKHKESSSPTVVAAVAASSPAAAAASASDVSVLAAAVAAAEEAAIKSAAAAAAAEAELVKVKAELATVRH